MEVATRDPEGRVRHWTVVDSYSVDKESLPRELFLPGPSRRLVLITCASRVVSEGGFHYEDNLVVELAPGRAPA